MSRTRREVVREDYRDITRDPREDEEWFLRLPEKAQIELQEHWAGRRVRHRPWARRNRRMQLRCVLEGIVALLLPAFLIGGFWLALVAMPVGAAVGLGWAALCSGRLRSAVLGMAGMAVLVTVSGFWSSRFDVAGFFFSAFGIVVAGFLSAWLGVSREFDRRDQAL